jgi:hypothetical protein
LLTDMYNRFRWASLQLQSLCYSKTDEAVQERLGRLPSGLEDLYVELYEKLTKDSADADREVTINAFSWLLCAQRTLSSAEFLAALSVTAQRSFSNLTKEQVLEMCSNMVVLDSALDTFRFAHLSVREFLEKQPDYSAAKTNCVAAERCLLDLLSATDHPATRKSLSRHGQHLPDSASHKISPYAAIYWATHCQLAADRRTVGLLKDLLLLFLSHESDPRSAIVTWNNLIKKMRQNYSVDWSLGQKLQDTRAKQGIAFFIACCFDFQEMARTQTDFGKDKVNSQGLTGLHVAVTYGSCKVVLILINNKTTEIGEEVVKAAAGNERNGKEVMTLLLEQRGADVVVTEEVLKAAAGNGENGKEVMALLLEQRGADVVVTEEVVKAAAGNGENGKEVMALLLEQRGAEVKISEEVLKAAAGNEENGKEVMALLLEQRGADVVVTEEVVKAAAGNWGNGKEVMTLLLEQRGADVVVTEEVVKAAAGNWGNGKEVMALLLEQRGAEVKISEEVLKAAAGNEESGEEILMLLLECRGPNAILTKDVVKAAATSGQEKVLKAIENRLELLVSLDDWLVAQFYNAAKAGYQVTIHKLIARGVEPDLRNPRNVSPLWVAATNGHLKVVELLLATKAVNVNSKCISGRPPIFYAAAKGYEDVVRLLLLAGADPSLVDEHGQTPISIAKQHGYDKIAKMLAGG